MRGEVAARRNRPLGRVDHRGARLRRRRTVVAQTTRSELMPPTPPPAPAPICRVPLGCLLGLAGVTAAVMAAARVGGLPFSDAAMLASAALAAAGFFRAGLTR